MKFVPSALFCGLIVFSGLSALAADPTTAPTATPIGASTSPLPDDNASPTPNVSLRAKKGQFSCPDGQHYQEPHNTRNGHVVSGSCRVNQK